MLERCFRVGIIGTGNIAGIMAKTLQRMKDVECYAVASRTIENAEKFAKQYNIPNAYGSYELLAASKAVDLIYIATLNPFHRGNAMLCLAHKTPVLVEKPFCMNAEEAKEVLDYAREQATFVAEAMPIRYTPLYYYIRDKINMNEIGKIKYVAASLCMGMQEVERLVKPDLGGGALLDLGVYLLHFADMIFENKPTSISADSIYTTSHIDSQNGIILTYKEGQIAMLHSAISYQGSNHGIIYGTNGKIEVKDMHNFLSVKVTRGKRVIAYRRARQKSNRYEYEILACKKALLQKEIECKEMPHMKTLRIMKQIDYITNKCNRSDVGKGNENIKFK